MTTNSILRPLLPLGLATWILTSTALITASAAVAPAERLLPDSSIAFVTVPDMVTSRKAYEKAPLTQLWNDPSMKPFRDKFMEKWDENLVKPLEKQLGIKFADYADIFQGQMTLALSAGPSKDKNSAAKEPHFLVLLDAGGKKDALKTRLAEVKSKWVDSGKSIKSTTIRNIEFTTLIFGSKDLSTLAKPFSPSPSDDKKEPDEKDGAGEDSTKKIEWLVGQSDSVLLMGNSAEEIEKVLVRLSGEGSGSLADLSAFAGEQSALARDSVAYGWVNLKSIVEIIKTLTAGQAGGPPGNIMGAFTPEKVLTTLGLTALQTLSFTTKQNPDGTLVQLNVSAPEAQRKGLVKLFAFDRKDSAPPSFVPADAVKFTRWRIDLEKGLNALESMLVEIDPGIGTFAKMVIEKAGKETDPNFDLRKSLFANLGDEIITYEKGPRQPTLEGMASPPFLVLLGSRNSEQLASALKTVLLDIPPLAGKIKEREFLGRKIYSLPPLPGADGGEEGGKQVQYVANSGYLAISTDVAMLEEFLRSSQSSATPLRGLSGLSDAADKVGGMQTGLFGFDNQAETLKVVIDILKKNSGSLSDLFNSFKLPGRSGGEGEPAVLKDMADFSLLPSFDKLAKFVYFNVYSGTIDAEGFKFRFFSPTPPGLR